MCSLINKNDDEHENEDYNDDVFDLDPSITYSRARSDGSLFFHHSIDKVQIETLNIFI